MASRSEQFAIEQARKRRSDSIWLVVLGGVAATPFIWSASLNRDMARNLYAERADCVADYSESECSTGQAIHKTSEDYQRNRLPRYHGPWFDAEAKARTNSDPGPGRFAERQPLSPGSSIGNESRPVVGHERGYRGGFGRTGSIRAGNGGFGS